MALTTEQQNQLEFQEAQNTLTRNNQQAERKAEYFRIAKEIVLENDRNKIAGERGITIADITVMADEINTYINS
jgi:hypothetical protein